LKKFKSLFVELIEVAVAEEVDWVENVPSTLLQQAEVSVLGAEYHPRSLVMLHRIHYVLLRHIDDVLFPDLKRTQSQSHFLLIRVASGEVNKPSERRLYNLIKLLECEELAFS